MPVAVQVQIGSKCLPSDVSPSNRTGTLLVACCISHHVRHSTSPVFSTVPSRFLLNFLSQLQAPQHQGLRPGCFGVPSIWSHIWHIIACNKLHERQNFSMVKSSVSNPGLTTCYVWDIGKVALQPFSSVFLLVGGELIVPPSYGCGGDSLTWLKISTP